MLELCTVQLFVEVINDYRIYLHYCDLGLPIVNFGRNMICADITLLRGVFNSTTNYILEQMEKGQTYADALKEAQKRGIAETDPTLDVEGFVFFNSTQIMNYKFFIL
jgi:homoserine dehydrogenase